jgi:hypothetical protein
VLPACGYPGKTGLPGELGHFRAVFVIARADGRSTEMAAAGVFINPDGIACERFSRGMSPRSRDGPLPVSWRLAARLATFCRIDNICRSIKYFIFSKL